MLFLTNIEQFLSYTCLVMRFTRNIKQSTIHFIIGLITFLMCMTCFSEPIKIVTNDNNPPFSFTLPDNSVTGLYVEFWQLWSKYNNQPIEIYLKPFEQSLEEVKYNKAVHSGVFITQDRTKWADFSSPIHRVETGILFNRNYSRSNQLNEFKQLKVALQSGSFQAQYIDKHYPNFETITYSDPDFIFNELLNNKIDAIISEVPFINAQLAKMGLNGVLELSDEVLMSNTIHAMVAKNQPELFETINNGINAIPVEEIIKLEKKWLPRLNPFHLGHYNLPFLTIEENHWLLNQDNITVGYDSTWYPIEFLDDTQNYNGIAADYIKHLSETLNIKFIPVYNELWADSLTAFKAGEIDVLSAVIATEKRLESITFTQPYLQVPTAIITRKDGFYVEGINQLKGKTLGLVNGFAIVELIQRDFPEINIVLVDSIVEGLKMIDQGDIDAYIGTLAVVNYEIDKNGFDNLKIAAFSPYKFEISMTVRKGLEPLAGIINKTIDQMSEKQKITIKNDWLAIYVDTGSNIKSVLEWLIPIILVLITIIIVISRFNKKLQNQIDQRKAAEKELKHLATHDALTNLPNWRNFDAQVNHILKTKQKHQHALLFIDLDGFKIVNDTHGHKTGDKVLIEAASRLKKIIDNNGIVARIGGDEFVIFIPQITDQILLKSLSDDIIEDINRPYPWQQYHINIGSSIGIAIYPNNAQTLDELVSTADAAMYQAKNAGKNQYKFF